MPCYFILSISPISKKIALEKTPIAPPEIAAENIKLVVQVRVQHQKSQKPQQK